MNAGQLSIRLLEGNVAPFDLSMLMVGKNAR
jgi:hypothetical protein